MKAWEICKEENIGKKYKDNEGSIWKVVSIISSNETYYDLKTNLERLVSFNYMSEIAELDFEEVIDWSKVPVDTKILVSNCINGAGEVIEWKKRHFAKYENGIVYAWYDGQTSFTAELDGSCMDWEFAKLYEEGEEQ